MSIIYLLGTFIIALAITPLFRQFARSHGILARENHRTSHEGEIPKLGGGAVVFAFLAGWAVYMWLHPDIFLQRQAEILSYASGAIMLFTLGAIDDYHDLNCTLKLVVEIIVAAFVVHYGWRIESIVLPANITIYLGWWGIPLTIFWIVGLVNAYNMSDGLDGLAGGIGFVVSLMSLTIAMLLGNTFASVIAILLMGAIPGFLRYNINPASVFMGDSGSLSIGFLLACMTLDAASVSSGQVIFVIPILLLGLPILDTTLAVIRRLRRGEHPFHPDRQHIHHRLVQLGLSHSGVALSMVLISLVFGFIAFLFAHSVVVDLTIH